MKILFTDGTIKTVLMDSISYVTNDNRGDILISGSHGGTSSAKYALDCRAGAALFNDAGSGKNNAGIKGFKMLQQAGIIAVAVSHESAEIGNAADTYEHGIVSYVNECAQIAGLQAGCTAAETVTILRAYLRGK
ncbi:MAG: hypothetical protein GY868_06670 [Deltaproteobacteria bacterium]|nr:hypothetical protein [Deltaproteobacteria bacterium]